MGSYSLLVGPGPPGAAAGPCSGAPRPPPLRAGSSLLGLNCPLRKAQRQPQGGGGGWGWIQGSLLSIPGISSRRLDDLSTAEMLCAWTPPGWSGCQGATELAGRGTKRGVQELP